MLVRLIYVSTSSPEFDVLSVSDMVKKARIDNAYHDITGMLLFSKNHFMQCIEGPRESVNELYGHIVNDSRHYNVCLMDYRDIDERSFGKWAMHYISDSDDLNEDVSHPYDLTGQDAVEILNACCS